MDKRYNFYNLEALFASYLTAVNENSFENEKKLSTVSKKNYLSDFRFFSGWYLTHNDLAPYKTDTEIVQSISESVIQNFLDYMTDSRLPIQTINRRLSSMRKFFEFAIHQNWVEINPAKKINNIRKEEEVLHTKEIREALNEYSENISDEKIIADLKDYFTNIATAISY